MHKFCTYYIQLYIYMLYCVDYDKEDHGIALVLDVYYQSKVEVLMSYNTIIISGTSSIFK